MPPTRRTALRTLAATGAAGLAGCAALDRFRGPGEIPPASVGTDWSSPDDEWRLPAADPHNTAASGLGVRGEPDGVWTLPAGDGGRVLAATADTVYVLTERTRPLVRARAAVDGTVRWRRELDRPSVRSGGLVDGQLILSVGSTDALALDADDGTTRWRVDLRERVADAVPSQFLPDDPTAFGLHLLGTPDTLYAQSAYGFHGLAPADGNEQWRVHVPTEVGPPRPLGLAVASTRVLASARFPGAFATLRDGAVETRPRPQDTVAASPPMPVDGGAVFSAGEVGSTGALSPVAFGYRETSEEPAWVAPGFADDGPSQVGYPATDGRRLYVCQLAPADAGFAVHVLSLSLDAGERAWARRFPIRADADPRVVVDRFAVGTPAIADDTLLVGHLTAVGDGPPDARLRALDLGDGSDRWTADVGVAPRHVAVAGDRVYVGGRRGRFAAFARSA